MHDVAESSFLSKNNKNISNFPHYTKSHLLLAQIWVGAIVEIYAFQQEDVAVRAP